MEAVSPTPRRFARARKVAVLCAIGIAIALFFAFGLQRYLTLAELKAQQAHLAALHAAHPVLLTACFIAAQVAALSLLLPGAVVIFALAAGAIFGPVWGTGIVLVAVTVGDSLSFLIARYLLRDWVEQRFGAYLGRFQAGIDRHGALYLLSLRLMAMIPFFVVNLAMGLTRMRLRVFAPVSFVGLVPATALHVMAGTQLSRIDSVADILSPALIATFVLLAVLPLAFRFLFRRWRAEEVRDAGSR